MEADLQSVNRTKTPWVILNGHRPIYTTNVGGSPPYGVIPVALDLQAALEPLLYTYSVELTWHGAPLGSKSRDVYANAAKPCFV